MITELTGAPHPGDVRIVVFTANLSYAARAGIAAIDQDVTGASWLVVVQARPLTVTRLLRNQISNLRANGWRWIPYQARDLLRHIAARKRISLDANTSGSYSAAEPLAGRGNVRIEYVDDLHGNNSLSMVAAFRPRLGLSLAAPILREPLYSLPSLGTLNLHKGRLPEYRGMPPAFWELWNDEREVGCTVHWVEKGLDTGDIVVSTSIERQSFSDLRGLQLRLETVGIRLMRDATVGVLEGKLRGSRQRPGGKTFRKPTLRQIEMLDKRLLGMLERRLRSGSAGPVSRTRYVVKQRAYDAANVIWKSGLRRLAAPRIKVLLYHRVTDEVRDNLTVGIGQFDRQMAFLNRRCCVLSIEQVVSNSRIPRSALPLVCVTFDDGYMDNYEHAMPILLRNRIPAAFFVSTGIVGSATPFPHDVRRGKARPPVMSWSQVRELHENGFTIGSHSVTHIDCAAESERVVRDELEESKRELEDRLGIREVIFAYPYGGRANMTAERVQMVRQAGYKACLSAYGGTNVGIVDQFNVLRGGIHWEMSKAAFEFQCLGIR